MYVFSVRISNWKDIHIYLDVVNLIVYVCKVSLLSNYTIKLGSTPVMVAVNGK